MSDVPPPDLALERDQWLGELGAGRLGHELLREHEALREQVATLQEENARLRAHLEADNAVRELLLKIDRLYEEQRELASRYERSEASSARVSERFREVEQQFSDLASLFVAANQLHSSLVPRRLLRALREVLAQLVGAQRFAVYVVSRAEGRLVPVAWEGLGSAPPSHDLATGMMATILRQGEASVCEGDPSQGGLQEPSAVLPLALDENSVGLIVIYATLPHKRSFNTLDFELFKLLGQHAAVALAGAGWFAASEGRLSAPEVFTERR